MSITGMVLAGGLGRRMGGLDKGLVPFLGRPMILHVMERLAPQVGDVLVNANREIDAYRALGLNAIQDQITGYVGPLAGLHAGLNTMKSDLLLTVPCDSPLLARDLAARLHAALSDQQADIATVIADGQAHPVFCLCRRSVLPSLENYLESGGRKVEAWQQSQKLVLVPFNDKPMAFSNINTLEELTALEQAA